MIFGDIPTISSCTDWEPSSKKKSLKSQFLSSHKNDNTGGWQFILCFLGLRRIFDFLSMGIGSREFPRSYFAKLVLTMSGTKQRLIGRYLTPV